MCQRRRSGGFSGDMKFKQRPVAGEGVQEACARLMEQQVKTLKIRIKPMALKHAYWEEGLHVGGTSKTRALRVWYVKSLHFAPNVTNTSTQLSHNKIHSSNHWK